MATRKRQPARRSPVRKRRGLAARPEHDPAWERLSAKYAGHPALQGEDVYALPTELIDQICKQTPGLLTGEDEEFERDLAQATPSGFFLQRRFGYPPLARLGAAAPAEEELDVRSRDATSGIRSMLIEEMATHGVPKARIDHFFDSATEEQRTIEERRGSYAGWLIMSSEFRRERDKLRRWHAAERPLQAPRRIPISMTGQGGPGLDDPWIKFFRYWNIEGFATWELPIPLRPELATPSLYPLPDVADAGLLLFIPWYLLRDRDIRLYDLAERQQLLAVRGPMQDWLDSKTKWGHKRYNQMLRLYVYLELCLKRRYPERVRGKIARIDELFAAYFSQLVPKNERLQDETIRKIRQEMARRWKE